MLLGAEGRKVEMSEDEFSRSIRGLRLVVHRLNTSPDARLPHIAPTLASVLYESRRAIHAIYAKPENARSSDASALVHNLRTRVGSLLQGSRGARLTAILLIKSLIESDSLEILSKAGTWIRTLLSSLEVCITPFLDQGACSGIISSMDRVGATSFHR